MPELPEVQRVVDGLVESAAGRRIVAVEVLWPGYVERVEPQRLDELFRGQNIGAAWRRGKYIFLPLDDFGLVLHLRMSGQIIKKGPQARPAHTHVLFRLDDGDELFFADTRKFGRMVVLPRGELGAAEAALPLGVEPLTDDFNPGFLAGVARGRERSIKNILMDQRLIAGIGNIYAAEALWHAGVRPSRPGRSLKKKDLAALVAAVKEVLSFALQQGGSSISDYRAVNGESGSMQNHFRVYGREGEPCLKCGAPVRREVDAGRSSFWCPTCQK